MPKLFLFIVAMSWGLGFVFTKNISSEFHILIILFLRFAIATVILLPFVFMQGVFESRLIFLSALVGMLLFLAFFFLTLGISKTSVTNAGVFSSFYVFWVSIIYSKINKRKLNAKIVTYLIVSIGGILLMSSLNIKSLNVGDVYILIASLFTSLHIVSLDIFGNNKNKIQFAWIQILTVAILSYVAIVYYGIKINIRSFLENKDLLQDLLFLSIFCTAIAFWVQIKFQPLISPIPAALIYNTEPVFAILFAYTISGELIKPLQIVGASIIIVTSLRFRILR